eukprot:Sro1266_g257540.2  (329) ;mRNA; f:1923-2911
MLSTRALKRQWGCWSFLFWSFLLLVPCADTTSIPRQDRDLIVNGVVPTDNSTAFPWFVFNRFGRSRGCGGTLIHKDIVLSAAHCHNVFQDRGLYVGGTTDYGMDGTFHEDETVVVHPSFDGDTLAHDLLLVKLETWNPQAATVTWGFDDSNTNNDTDDIILTPQTGQEVLVIGFGTTLENGPLSLDLLQATVHITDQEFCRDYYQQNYDTPVTDDQVCAMDNATTNASSIQDACYNDSGGPLLQQLADGSFQQVGIIIFSIGCARPNVPAVYVRLNAYKDWIQQGICELSYDPPVWCDTITTTRSNYSFTTVPSPGQSASTTNPGSSGV